MEQNMVANLHLKMINRGPNHLFTIWVLEYAHPIREENIRVSLHFLPHNFAQWVYQCASLLTLLWPLVWKVNLDSSDQVTIPPKSNVLISSQANWSLLFWFASLTIFFVYRHTVVSSPSCEFLLHCVQFSLLFESIVQHLNQWATPAIPHKAKEEAKYFILQQEEVKYLTLQRGGNKALSSTEGIVVRGTFSAASMISQAG